MIDEGNAKAYTIKYPLKERSGREYIEEKITNNFIGYVAWINNFFKDTNEEIFKKLKTEVLTA